MTEKLNVNHCGLDSIELDVWLTKDKIPIVIHGGDDGSIAKYLQGEGKINEMNFDAKEEVLTPVIEEYRKELMKK